MALLYLQSISSLVLFLCVSACVCVVIKSTCRADLVTVKNGVKVLLEHRRGARLYFLYFEYTTDVVTSSYFLSGRGSPPIDR